MVARSALVLVGGVPAELPTGDTLNGVPNGGITDPLDLTDDTPETPPADVIRLFRRAFAGRQFVAMIGPSGVDTTLQPGLHGNAVFMLAPASGTTAPVVWGGTLTTVATMSMPTLASTNNWTAIQRKRFQTAVTAASLTGMRTAYTQWWRGNANGRGGFFFRCQFGQQLNITGAQAFIGLCASTGALATTAGAVAALVNTIGMGYDTTDANTGNWFLYRNDATGVATKLNLGVGAARNAVDAYDLMIFCRPYSTTEQNIWVQITNIVTGAVVLAATELTTDLPVATTFLAMKAEINNGAVAAAANLEVSKLYVESDQ